MVSAPSGQYTLYSSSRNPFDGTEHGREDRFNDLADALSAAWVMTHHGRTPTHVLFDNAVLFSGDDLKQVLADISARGAQPDVYPIEIVRQMMTDVLVRQLAKTVHFSHEHFGAVAVYRSMLEDLYEAADQAIKANDLGLLHKITGKLAFWYIPSESDAKQMGKDFLHAYRRDAGWLRDTKDALEKILDAVKELKVEEGSRNAELQGKIIETAERGLITHI